MSYKIEENDIQKESHLQKDRQMKWHTKGKRMVVSTWLTTPPFHETKFGSVLDCKTYLSDIMSEYLLSHKVKKLMIEIAQNGTKRWCWRNKRNLRRSKTDDTDKTQNLTWKYHVYLIA